MATQEFYVRQESETDARGPFNLEQLGSLAENGQISPETLYYEMDHEQWMPIAGNPGLRTALFPDQEKLRIKPAEPATTADGEPSANRGRTVGEMLAEAEGLAPGTRTNPAAANRRRAALLARWSTVLILLLAALAEWLPARDFLQSFAFNGLKSHPLVILGGADLALALLLVLGLVTLYPLVRLRAALGLGFLGFIYYVQGRHLLLLAVAAGSAGLFLATIPLRTGLTWLWTLLGVIGMAGLLWLQLAAA